MSISSVILRGFNNPVDDVVTRGYSIGAEIVPEPVEETGWLGGGGWVEPPGWQRRKRKIPEPVDVVEVRQKRKPSVIRVGDAPPSVGAPTGKQPRGKTIADGMVEGLDKRPLEGVVVQLKPLRKGGEIKESSGVDPALQWQKDEEEMILMILLAIV